MPAKGKKRAKATGGHQLAAAVPKGTEMKDLKKKSWFIGEPIGSGGFGLIYLASDTKEKISKDKAKHVIKVEPQGNGPLFCEIAFYQRAARAETLNAWKKRAKLPHIGIPAYIAHGLHGGGKEDLRFMVMPRYGSDLQNIWDKAHNRFSRQLVCQLAIQLINALEFMHNNEYVHADVKGGNILLGHNDPSQIYLVDFGLAYRYVVDGKHKEYHEDPRKAHDGTIEYTSRDAHLGVAPSRRSDLEILGYVLLHWLCGKLPWDDKLTDKNYVKDQKVKHMKNVKNFVGSIYPEAKSSSATELQKFLQYVSKLEYNEEPDYDGMRKYFQDALKSMGVSVKSKIEFNANEVPESSNTRKRRSQPKMIKNSEADDSIEESPKRPRRTPKAQKPPNKVSEEHSTSTVDESPIYPKRQRKVNKRPASAQNSSNKKASKAITRTIEDSSTDEHFTPAAKTSAAKRRKRAVNQMKSLTESKDSSSVDDDFGKSKKLVLTRSSITNPEDSSTDENQKPAVKTSVQYAKRAVNHIQSYREYNESSEVEDSGESKDSSGKRSSTIILDDSSDEDYSPTTHSPSQHVDRPLNRIKSRNKSARSSPQVENSEQEAPPRKLVDRSGKQSAMKSRYSMAPLHTQSVLAKDDKLTGKYLGKHPVIYRRRKVKRQTTDAITQTTPTLRKRTSRA